MNIFCDDLYSILLRAIKLTVPSKQVLVRKREILFLLLTVQLFHRVPMKFQASRSRIAKNAIAFSLVRHQFQGMIWNIISM